MNEGTLKVKKIGNGTVIDHIPPGKALAVLKILKIKGGEGFSISILMNVASKKFGKKDLVKIENRELTTKEVNKIALIAPNITINIVRNFEVKEKRRVKLPKSLRNVVNCSNPVCITNTNEPVEPEFTIIETQPVVLLCKYCQRHTTEEDFMKDF